MSHRAVSWLVWSVVALAVFLGVLGSLLLLLNDRFLPPLRDSFWYTLAFLNFLVVGVLIASRRPENPIGWMFCLIGLASAWEFFAQEYAIYALVTQPGTLPTGVWIAWTQEVWTATIAWMLMLFALLLFPTGRLPSPGWRPFAWFAAGALVLTSLLSAFEPGRLPGVRVPNPTGIQAAAGIIELSMNIMVLVVSGIVLVIAASVIVRFRRARGEERQQLKWLAYTAGFLSITLGLGLLNFQVLHNRVIEVAAGVLGNVAIVAVPTAIAIAILRYRLYEIDILINRTLVYILLTVTLVALYFGGIMVLQRLFVLLTGQQSTLAVVASTLAIAAIFNPLRRRIQSLVDRRFYRKKYDARKTLEAFSKRLRDETDLEALNDDLVGIVSETMQPAHVRLWLRPGTASKGQPTE